ncbi:MAG: DNA-binding response regulator [Planctomycetota bacterium]|nr:MAG: DNA-binding response regulator [Planctomycetota bacterium]
MESSTHLPSVLIVDDDPKLRDYLARGLGESGYATRTAADGESALDALREAPADIVLLDVMLPDMHGWDVLTAMREEGLGAPVIFVTARDALDERIRGLRLGGDDYVVKPFALTELLARIEAVLRRDERSLVARVGDLEIDHRHGRVTRAEQTLDLTRTELGLLRRLAEAGGRAVSRSDLLTAVWGIDFDPGTNIVDVHIRRLRQKVDAPFERPLVHTVRGEGYALEDRG